jgi:glyoxylate reductase/D-3-phosphoglycerate dehydrogenase
MPEPRIVFAPELDPDVLAIAEQHRPPGFRFDVVSMDDLPAAAREADYLMGFIRTMSPEALAAASRVKLIQLLSVGYDKFNLEAAREARIPVAINGGANAIAVAEHAIMLMLAAMKHLTELDQRVRAGGWRDPSHSGLRPYEIWSSTVGILGLGRIGQEVARRLSTWEAKLVYYDPYRLPPEREQELGVTYVSFDELMSTSDVITVHVPWFKETYQLVNARAISLMKPTAVIVNTSRGGLIEEKALYEALRDGKIKGAGLDVLDPEPPEPENPMFKLPNVAFTPHLAGPTWQSWPRRFTNGFANIQRVERGEKPQWVVPELAELVG